jgi:hypothetical protein
MRFRAGSFAFALFALGTLALASSACGITDPSSNTTDTFSGVMGPGFLPDIHTFTVSKNGGEYSTELTALLPDTGATLGIIVAQSIGNNACSAILFQGIAALSKTAASGPISSGTYCVEIFDNQLLTRAETYTLTVSHP